MFTKGLYFLKRLDLKDVAVILIVIIAGGYILIAPIVFPIFKKQILKIPSLPKEKFTERKVIILRKPIYRIQDIVPINCKSVMPIVYTKVISLKGLPIKEKKKKFIDIILPSILIANFNIQVKRKKILLIQEKLEKNVPLTKEEEEFLEKMLNDYKAHSIFELLEKVNTHPPSLIIAQAAIESGWGTSRFFVEANNVFGMWTFNKKSKRKIKASRNNVYLLVYPDILASVEDYYYSLNVGNAYKRFRFIRLKTKDPLKLSNYLDKYSILRENYVKRIKTIIKSNNLTVYDSCKLDPTYID